LNVTGMVHGLTYHRKLTIAQVGSDNLKDRLTSHYERLSPLFEQHMAVISNYSIQLTSQLAGFYQSYNAFEGCLRTIRAYEVGAPPTPALERALGQLPVPLDYADRYARAALYLLPLYEIGTLRGWYWRLRRRWWPDQHDKDSKALIAQLENTAPRAEAPG